MTSHDSSQFRQDDEHEGIPAPTAGRITGAPERPLVHVALHQALLSLVSVLGPAALVGIEWWLHNH